MKILADEDITDVAKLFGRYGQVITCPGRQMTSAQLQGIDALLVRSVTQVNPGLLMNSSVGFVGSATIGTDHVDVEYLQRRNIRFAHAPGCNANAVVQYVIAALCGIAPGWREQTVGVIGCGNVGGRLVQCLQRLGLACKIYDPFISESPFLNTAFFKGASQGQELVDFSEAMAADIVCVHTPLTTTGDFPTHHMINRPVLEAMRAGAVLINAGRGAVIDNNALLEVLKTGQALRVVLDVWEHEPAIDTSLLDKVVLGTPHIAGHSVDGKLRGTQMILESYCRWLKEPAPVFDETDTIVELQLDDNSSLESVVLGIYDPADDCHDMVRALTESVADTGPRFDSLRRSYTPRREFKHFEVSGISNSRVLQNLAALGFKINRPGSG